MPQDKRTATYKILGANVSIVESLLEAKEKSEGYRCLVFFPVGSDSVYGVLDQFVYRKKPDLDKLFVCLSAVQDSSDMHQTRFQCLTYRRLSSV